MSQDKGYFLTRSAIGIKAIFVPTSNADRAGKNLVVKSFF